MAREEIFAFLPIVVVIVVIVMGQNLHNQTKNNKLDTTVSLLDKFKQIANNRPNHNAIMIWSIISYLFKFIQ